MNIQAELDYLREELDRAERCSSEAQRRVRCAHAAEVSNLQESLDSVYAELHEAKAELALYDEFLKLKGLYDEFNDWASYRRFE